MNPHSRNHFLLESSMAPWRVCKYTGFALNPQSWVTKCKSLDLSGPLFPHLQSEINASFSINVLGTEDGRELDKRYHPTKARLLIFPQDKSGRLSETPRCTDTADFLPMPLVHEETKLRYFKRMIPPGRKVENVGNSCTE